MTRVKIASTRIARMLARAAALVLAPSVAHAEGAVPDYGDAGRPCKPTAAIASGPLPRNVPGIPFRPSSEDPNVPFALVSESGIPVGATTKVGPDPTGVLLIVPDTPPPAGHYLLTHEERCDQQTARVTASPVLSSIPIELVSEQPLPTSLGTVMVRSEVRNSSVAVTPSCTLTRTQVFLSIDWTPSAELMPFIGVTAVEARWSDQYVYGSFWQPEAIGSLNLVNGGEVPCDRGVDPAHAVAGSAFVVFRALVAGIDHDLAPVIVPIDPACPSTALMPHYIGDCPGVPDVDSGAAQSDASSEAARLPSVADADAPVPELTASPSPASNPVDAETGGCALGRMPHRHGWGRPMMLLLALAAVLRRRCCKR